MESIIGVRYISIYELLSFGSGTETKKLEISFLVAKNDKVSIEFNSPTNLSSLKTANPIFSLLVRPLKDDEFDLLEESFCESILVEFSSSSELTPPKIA